MKIAIQSQNSFRSLIELSILHSQFFIRLFFFFHYYFIIIIGTIEFRNDFLCDDNENINVPNNTKVILKRNSRNIVIFVFQSNQTSGKKMIFFFIIFVHLLVAICLFYFSLNVKFNFKYETHSNAVNCVFIVPSTFLVELKRKNN